MMNLLEVVPGARLRTVTGREGAVVENIGDGQWLKVRFPEDDEPELIHAQDIASVTAPQED